MNLKKKYIECKQRNEQQISNIQSLESRILEIQNKIKIKQTSVDDSKRAAAQWNRLTKSHKEFQKSATCLITEEDQTKSLISLGRRDLTQLVATTPHKICKKIETLIAKQVEQNQVISEDELLQIKTLIERLPDKNDTQQFIVLVEEIQNKLEMIHIDTTKYETENVKDSLKYQSLLDYLDDQNQRVRELTKRRNELQLNTGMAENELIKRIRSTYKEPELQSILTKHMRLKAAANQVDVELSSTKAQVDKIYKKIQSIEDSTDTLNMGKTIKNLMKNAENKQMQLQSMILANKKFREVMIDHENQATTSDMDEKELMQQLSTIEQYLNQPTPDPVIVEEPIDKTMDIRYAISPKSLISTSQAISEIVNTIDSVNSLSRNSVISLCADIRAQLEQLVQKWDASLDKQNIPVSEKLPADYDGIDTVIQSVDALTLYIQNKELSYISEQQQKIRSKLNVADKIEKEIETAQDSLDQRFLVKDIGRDYTVQNKSFAQWLDHINHK